MEAEQFTISVTNDVFDDLRARLELAAQQSGPGQPPIPACSRPELRILSW